MTWTADVQRERDETTKEFHDGRKSPLAAIERHDFKDGEPLELTLGADKVVLRALPDGFEMGGKRLPPSAKVELGRYTLRLSHQNFPGVVVLDSQSPRLKTGPFPRWYAIDPRYRVEARLVRPEKPEEIVILSTRGNRRRALKAGVLEFTLQGQALRLTATRLLEPGVGENSLSVFFRDATTGKGSYPVGRYVELEAVTTAGLPPAQADRYVLDFNGAYNPTCAFSELYNCPIPPRENVLSVAVPAGERDPH